MSYKFGCLERLLDPFSQTGSHMGVAKKIHWITLLCLFVQSLEVRMIVDKVVMRPFTVCDEFNSLKSSLESMYLRVALVQVYELI